jgi:hypothetical protein
MAAEPCIAAEIASNDASRQSGAFAGAYFRMPLGGERSPDNEARAGLRMGVAHVYRGVSAETAERRIEAGLVDLGIFRSGRPSLMLGGRQMIDRRGRFSLQGDEDGGGVSPWLIVGGVVVLAIGVGALVLAERLKCHDHDDEC